MLNFKCYKAYVTDMQGNEKLVFVPTYLIAEFLDNAIHDSRVVLTDIIDVNFYETSKQN